MLLNNGFNVIHEFLLYLGRIVVNSAVIKISGWVSRKAKRSFFWEHKKDMEVRSLNFKRGKTLFC